jgi:hypothetical protein
MSTRAEPPSPRGRPPVDDTSSGDAAAIGDFPALAAPTVVHASKLTAEAIARWGLKEVEYVVLEPCKGGVRVRPAAIEDELKHEQESGAGRLTYSLAEFLDEFDNAPLNAAPTFDRLTQFKRDYAKLTPGQRQQFRAAAKKAIAPLSTTPPGDIRRPLVKELDGHSGFWELWFDRDLRAVYTFGQSVRKDQPHVIWCRIGSENARDKETARRDVTAFRPSGLRP